MMITLKGSLLTKMIRVWAEYKLGEAVSRLIESKKLASGRGSH